MLDVMDRHNNAVAVIASNVRQFYDRKEPFRIFHGSTNTTRQSTFVHEKAIDVSGLSYVLHVDKEKCTALVEPNVSMDRLVETTLKYGLIPPVVMEFPGITVGGGYAGTSGESSSFRRGFFDRTLNFVEMVLANGEVIRASNDENADLFHGAAGAVGSLGITTLVEIQLVEAKHYVETVYHPVSSMTDALAKLKEVTADESIEYVDGIMFSSTQGVVITGHMTDAPQSMLRVQRFSRAIDPWFYLHVKEIISKARPTGMISELIPIDEYLFRYDRGGFWVGLSAFQYFYTPFNWVTRWFLDDYLHTRMMYLALHASRHTKPFVVHDLALPYSSANEFVEYTDKAFGIWPLWLCPLRQSAPPTFHPHCSDVNGHSPKDILNIGLWGWGPSNREAFIAVNRQLEHKLRELGGMKWLYSQIYYTEAEFWDIYDRKRYDQLRNTYHANSLPTVYQKVKVDIEAEDAAIESSWTNWLISMWPFSGLWGVWIALKSGQKSLANKSTWRSIEEKDCSR